MKIDTIPERAIETILSIIHKGNVAEVKDTNGKITVVEIKRNVRYKQQDCTSN